MTNHPRYSPPPQQPGYRPVPDQRGAPGYSGHGQQQTYPQHFDWRYGQQPPSTAAAVRLVRWRSGPAPPAAHRHPPGIPRKRSRAGALAVGALAIAVVSAGIGGAAASVIEHHGQLPFHRRRNVTGWRGSQRAGRERPGGHRRTGRRQGGAQRGHARDRSRSAVRGGLGHHLVFRRADPDQQPRRRHRGQSRSPRSAARRPAARGPGWPRPARAPARQRVPPAEHRRPR